MFARFLVSLVDFSRRFAALMAGVALALTLALGAYVVKNISINTDINQLLAENLPWRQREKALEVAFPHKIDTIVAVIDAEDPLRADNAAASLAEKLKGMPDKFTFVSRPDALPIFRTSGLLYLSTDELANALDQMTQAQPMLGAIAADPSLRGFLSTIGMMMQGVSAGAVDPAQIERPLKEIAATVRAAVDGKDRALNFRNMMPESNDPFASRELRKYIIAKPVLDYAALAPGEAASAAIRQGAADLGLTPENDVRVRLTGSVPLNDEEFASVAEGAGLSTSLSGILVLALLFMALRSWRIVLPIGLTLLAGLVASTAFATFAVGSLNLISVAFAVMFIGIAVDFGIQFGVRYRDEHQKEPDHAEALRNTARVIAAPLAMAAGATALGFLSFTPTDYRGVSELGLIAGAGMIIAFILNVTLLPALMTLTKPSAENERIGFTRLAPLNFRLAQNRKGLIAVIGAVAALGLAAATFVRFDFDPLNLKDPKTESVSTMFEAMQDPDSDAYAAQILAASEMEARRIAAELEKLPEVDHAMTLRSFVPEDQDEKLAMIADTEAILQPTFALSPQTSPSREENIEAARKTAELIRQASAKLPAAKDLADALDKLAAASPEAFERAQKNLVTPMQAKFAEIKQLLKPRPIAFADLPEELKKDWITADGRWLVEALPKRGPDKNPRDPQMLERFIHAVQKVAPDAGGTPVSIRESGRTIVSAFIHAGLYGFISIALLSAFILRKPKDIILMLTPLVLAGILTLATMALVNMPLNYANIIALPLLFSLGVSYAVYFVFFVRQSRRDFLQSSMARAVLFSAATVLVAFISLSFSSHTGTQGMGEILTISLLYLLLCTFIVLPVLYSSDKKDTVR
ncbi:MAG: MMPL family transporter [Alphaproteobacteria bacterium]|nr:MMPL family transporter [Alphaproteobacteria bacterium]